MDDKLVFNKNELMNFTMMIGVNMMMFGIILGFVSVIGQYIERIFNIADITRNNTRTDKDYNVFNLEQKAC